MYISNLGRVKSYLRNERILKMQKDAKGYLRVSVTLDGVKHTFKVHRLVAQAFIPNLDNKPQVNHIDGNKENNHSSNLEWVTNAENARHAMKAGLWDSVKIGALQENEGRKKTVLAVEISTGNKILFESVSDAEHFVGSRHVTDVLKGRRYKCKGYRFYYITGGDANVNADDSATK